MTRGVLDNCTWRHCLSSSITYKNTGAALLDAVLSMCCSSALSNLVNLPLIVSPHFLQIKGSVCHWGLCRVWEILSVEGKQWEGEGLGESNL